MCVGVSVCVCVCVRVPVCVGQTSGRLGDQASGREEVLEPCLLKSEREREKVCVCSAPAPPAHIIISLLFENLISVVQKGLSKSVLPAASL